MSDLNFVTTATKIALLWQTAIELSRNVLGLCDTSAMAL